MKDKVYQYVASLLPRRLAYHCTIRVGVFATTGQYGNTIVPELTLADALQRWDKEYSNAI